MTYHAGRPVMAQAPCSPSRVGRECRCCARFNVGISSVPEMRSGVVIDGSVVHRDGELCALRRPMLEESFV